MKTPEEWAKEIGEWFGDMEPTKLLEFVRAIQLDAIRHGLSLAAEIAQQTGERVGDVSARMVALGIKVNILTASDNLTK